MPMILDVLTLAVVVALTSMVLQVANADRYRGPGSTCPTSNERPSFFAGAHRLH
jgi:hypothetical protein